MTVEEILAGLFLALVVNGRLEATITQQELLTPWWL